MKSQRSTSVEFPVIQTIICLHSKWKWKVRGGGKRGQEKLTQRLHVIFKKNTFKDQVSLQVDNFQKVNFLTFLSKKIDIFFTEGLELVSKELNHLAAILHVYAGGFEFYEVEKKLLLFFKKEMEILLHFLSFL